MKKIYLSGHCRPSAYMRRISAHQGNVSEGTEERILAVRTILGKKVRFFTNGRRELIGTGLSEEEQHNSEILRLAHASLIINDAVGDARGCYVDARVDPCIVKFWQMDAEDFLKKAIFAVRTGAVPMNQVLDDSDLRNLKHVGNVRLPGRQPYHTHLSYE